LLFDQGADGKASNDLLQKGRIMCRLKSFLLLAGFASLVAGNFANVSQAQIAQRAAIQDSSAKVIGKIIAASGTVSIERAGAMVVQASTAGQDVTAGDAVYQGDVVKTGADGRVGINFADGSSFNLSSNARIALDEFVYDPGSKSNSTFFNLTKGTITFVAGQIAKGGDMKVDTPVATMGIRGTTPRIEIANDGAVKFSTLIEAGKSKLSKARAPLAERRVEFQDRDKLDLKICRGC
jgi:hypothetical protein